MTQAATPLGAAVSARSDRDPFAPFDWGLLAGLSLVWGSSFLLIAIGLETLHPGVVTWLRLATGAAALLALRRTGPRITGRDGRMVVLLSVLWVGIPFTLYPIAEQHVNSAVAGILNGATPVWAALFATSVFGRRTRGAQVVGLVVGFAGMVLVSVSSSGGGDDSATFGIALVLVATVLYGLSVNLLGPLQQRHGAVPVTTRMLTWSVLWTTPYGVYGLRASLFSWRSVVAVVVLGVVGTGVAFVLMAMLTGRVGGPRASFVTYVMPIVATVLGIVVLGDEVHPGALVGVALVIAGAVAASRREG